jgi:hypothetical protein
MPTFPRRTDGALRSDNTFWERLSPTARHGLCLGLLLVVALMFYSPAIFGGKAIHGSDTVNWRATAEVLLEYQEQTGERALWTPNVFGGMPGFLIDYGPSVPQLDDLVSATRSVAWPASHLFVLLAGMYLLLVYLTRSHFSGLLAALAFGFTTYLPIILGVGHNTKFIALAYVPFLVLTFVYALRNPSLLAALLFALVLALDLRARHPQITYGVLMMLLVWWAVEGGMAWRAGEETAFAKSTGWLALGTGLALLMVAHPYLAIYQYKQYSIRGAEAVAEAGGGSGGAAMGWERAMQWSQGVQELLTLLIAEALGGGGRTYWGPKTFTEGPHYVGGVVLALSGLAVWRVRSRLTWGLGAGVGVTVLFALGKHAAWLNRPMFEFFPFFDAFRAPETWLSISALGLAGLAGVGLDYVLRRDEGDEADKTRAVLYVFGGLAALVLLMRVGPNLFLDFEKPNERQRLVRAIQQQRPDLSVQSRRVQQFIDQRMQERKTKRVDAFTADATRTLLALGAALLLLWLYRRQRLSGWLVGGLVVLIVLVDLWGVDRRYLGPDDYSSQTQTTSQIPTTEVDRFIKDQVEKEGPGRFRVLPFQTPYSQSPANNAISSYHYQSLGGYHGAKLQRYEDYLDHILQLSPGRAPNENALDLMNTRYIIARQQLPGTEVVYRGNQKGFVVLENPDAVPRGFLVGQTDVVREAEATWRRLRDPSFNPRTTALLASDLDAPVTPIDSGSTASVALESYAPPEIRWTIETDAPRLFVASEVYYPAGWTAYLDGTEVPIHRVNYLLRGVHVPEGEHTLVMRFEPAADRYGTWISAASTLFVYGGIAAIVGRAYRRRRAGAADDDTDASDES